MKRIEAEQDITDLIHAAKALAVLSAYTDLGLFDALAKGPRSAAELGIDPRAFDTTVPILLHLGLLAGDGRRFALSAAGRMLHDAGRLPTSRNYDFLRDLSRIGDVLTEGGPVRDDEGRSKVTTGGVRPDDPETSRRFLDMLYRASQHAASETLTWTRHLLPAGGRVLDLGGGHGRYGRVYADAGYRVTLADLPLVIELARERHGQHLEYVAGDFLHGLDLGGPYDLALLSNIVHGQSVEENRALIGRLASALAPGGVLVLKDMFLDERGRDPARAAFFGLTMLFYTEGGRSYSLAEATGWCEAAGLQGLAVTSLETHDLLIARRKRPSVMTSAKASLPGGQGG